MTLMIVEVSPNVPFWDLVELQTYIRLNYKNLINDVWIDLEDDSLNLAKKVVRINFSR
ncbi:hypothetical protein ISS04_03265 [Candidatus Woesearchaeota archaeon]|nr:hypothetical protein [Candidatus Woesearchaeota archaeon]